MISDKLKLFLKKQVEDLKNNNLDPIFSQIEYYDDNDLIEELKDLLIEQGIDPLEYITKIPAFYFRKEDYKTLDLSSYTNIKVIGARAFNYCNINTLILPNSISTVRCYAFYHSAINELIIPESTYRIEQAAFSYASINILHLPNSLQLVSRYAFEHLNCDNVIYKGGHYSTLNYPSIQNTIFEALESNGVKII